MSHAAVNAAVIAANSQSAQRRAEQQTLDAFRVADATASQRALPLSRITGAEADALARLRERGIVREAAGGRLYLDERAVIAARDTDPGREGNRAAVAIIAGLAVLGVVLLLALLFLA